MVSKPLLLVQSVLLLVREASWTAAAPCFKDTRDRTAHRPGLSEALAGGLWPRSRRMGVRGVGLASPEPDEFPATLFL